MTQPYETLLVITGLGIPPFSAVGVTQVLAPIAASANMRRTVNGALINLSPGQFDKYRSTISCSWMNSPACDGVFPGMTVTVDCVSELAYLTAGGAPQRPAVEDSPRTVGPWTFYRPRLEMMLTSPIEVTTDEWGGVVGWSMELEEV
jgi:hypothetical protein